MAGFFSTINKVITLMTSAMFTLTSCGVIYDDLEPCNGGAKMRFVYDYNLESANAFPAQVDCLTLHIYDADGNFIKTVTEESSVLADEDWRMEINLDPGKYHAVAYGGIACDKASFAHALTPGTGSNYQNISMQLKPGEAGKKLHDHFHGAVDFEINGDALDYTPVTLRMTKTTNNVRVLLQNINGEPLDGNDFEFSIIDDNTVLDHTNMPVAGHSTIYNAWRKGQFSTAEAGNPDNAETDATGTRADDIRIGYGDLSTSRLHLTTGARLVVHSNESQKDVLSLPLCTYLAMCNNYDFGDQEFLDRCSNYTLALLLGNDNNWICMEISVAGYTVRINNIDFEK